MDWTSDDWTGTPSLIRKANNKGKRRGSTGSTATGISCVSGAGPPGGTIVSPGSIARLGGEPNHVPMAEATIRVDTSLLDAEATAAQARLEFSIG